MEDLSLSEALGFMCGNGFAVFTFDEGDDEPRPLNAAAERVARDLVAQGETAPADSAPADEG